MSNNARIFVYIIIVPLIISILFIIYGLFKFYLLKDKKSSIFSNTGPKTIFSGGLALFILQFLLYGFILRVNAYHFVPKDPSVKTSTMDIASINLNSSTGGNLSGSFILGSGSINYESKIESYFYFYVKDEAGRYKLDKLNSEDVLLEETNEVSPSILISKTYDVVETVPTKFGKLIGFKTESREYLDESLTETIIRIPNGSIVQEYNPNFN